MKARQKPAQAGASSRYWTVDVPGKGTHLCRHPYYGVGAAVVATMTERAKSAPDPDDRDEERKALDLLPMAGLLIGSTWHNVTHELETRLPLGDLSAPVLTEYGHAVADELQEAGYDLLTMLEMFASIAPEMNRRQSLIAQALDRSSFSAAPTDGSTGS
jgi:hypothetical protein